MRTLSLCLVALAFASGCQTKTTARGPKPAMEPLPSTGIGTTNPSGIAPVDNTGAAAGPGSMPLGGIGGGPQGPIVPRTGTITKPTEVIKIDESGGATGTESYPMTNTESAQMPVMPPPTATPENTGKPKETTPKK